MKLNKLCTQKIYYFDKTKLTHITIKSFKMGFHLIRSYLEKPNPEDTLNVSTTMVISQ